MEHYKDITLNEIKAIKILSYLSFNRCIKYYYQINFPIELSNIILSFISINIKEDEYVYSQKFIHFFQIQENKYLQHVNEYIFEEKRQKQILLHNNNLCDLNDNCSQCLINTWETWNYNCNL